MLGGSYGFDFRELESDQYIFNQVSPGIVGFRVALVPEPSTAVLAIMAWGLMWVLRKRFTPRCAANDLEC